MLIAKKLLIVASEFECRSGDSFWFFRLPEDNNDARQDHATSRTWERAPNHHIAQQAIRHVEKVLGYLSRDYRDLIARIPLNTSWTLPCPGGLTAIIIRVEGGLRHATTIPPGEEPRRKIDGNLELEIRKLDKLK